MPSNRDVKINLPSGDATSFNRSFAASLGQRISIAASVAIAVGPSLNQWKNANEANEPSRCVVMYLTLVILSVVGCGRAPDERLAEFAQQSIAEQRKQNDRIADQSLAVVEESHQLAEAAKDLVERDAEARRELIAAQQELTSQLNEQQSDIYSGHDQLEQDRPEIAEQRHRDPFVTLVVEAGDSKHRRKDTIPLHSILVELLRSWLPELRNVAASRSIYAANQASPRGSPSRQRTPVVTQKAKTRLTQVPATSHLLTPVDKKRHRLSSRCLSGGHGGRESKTAVHAVFYE